MRQCLHALHPSPPLDARRRTAVHPPGSTLRSTAPTDAANTEEIMASLPKDAQELFDVLVPQGLKAYTDKAREVNAIYGFKISGDGGGEWTVDLTSNPPTCVRGDTGKAQCTIEIAHEDFKSMLTDPNAGMQLYF